MRVAAVDPAQAVEGEAVEAPDVTVQWATAQAGKVFLGADAFASMRAAIGALPPPERGPRERRSR